MSFFQNAFGDNRVLTAKNPDVQKMLTYMENTYQAHIVEYKERSGNWYCVQCQSKKYFSFLYCNGLISSGTINVPGTNGTFNSKTEAYQGLLWLYDLLEGKERGKRLDEELF